MVLAGWLVRLAGLQNPRLGLQMVFDFELHIIESPSISNTNKNKYPLGKYFSSLIDILKIQLYGIQATVLGGCCIPTPGPEARS